MLVRAITRQRPPRLNPGVAAFTLIEIALALGVIAIGLVSIIGLMPFGLGVQRENKDETVIDHDARLMFGFLKAGAAETNDLETLGRLWLHIVPDAKGQRKVWVTNTVITYELTTRKPVGEPNVTVTELEVVDPRTPVRLNPEQISLASVLSAQSLAGTVQYDLAQNRMVVSRVQTTMFMRAQAGSAYDKYPQTNQTVTQMAFTYKLVRELFPLQSTEVPFNNSVGSANPPALPAYEARLSFAWPAYGPNSTGYGRRVYRAIIVPERSH